MPDIPLLAGYVHKHDGQLEEAVKDFTEAIERDPNTVTAYTNRGYMLNDLIAAATGPPPTSKQSLKREPRNGEAHMGLAFAELDLDQPKAAIRQTRTGRRNRMGDFRDLHIIRATAYGREGHARQGSRRISRRLELRPRTTPRSTSASAISSSPSAATTPPSTSSRSPKNSCPDDASIYAMHGPLQRQPHDREQTLHYVELAERNAEPAPPPAADAGFGSQHAQRHLRSKPDRPSAPSANKRPPCSASARP